MLDPGYVCVCVAGGAQEITLQDPIVSSKSTKTTPSVFNQDHSSGSRCENEELHGMLQSKVLLEDMFQDNDVGQLKTWPQIFCGYGHRRIWTETSETFCWMSATFAYIISFIALSSLDERHQQLPCDSVP